MQIISVSHKGVSFNLKFEIDYDSDEIDYALKQAKLTLDYFYNQTWYEPIKEIMVKYLVEGIICVNLVVFNKKINNTDSMLWYIGGDLPQAYIVCDNVYGYKDALKSYERIMRDWINAVRNASDISKLFPINVPPNNEYANMLESRLNFISKNIL